MKYHVDNKEERLAKQREYHFRKSYGLTLEEVQKMKDDLGGCCPVCGNSDLVIDHCHNSSRVRGMLCNRCNQGLGLMRESKEYLTNLIAYIEEYELKSN
ncbi:MAG: hypothetical protein COA78_20475 [Blastopirellula sp.]|nr:MAG: hypothetical protein COA78_20475 [Blastopirellula sp.]